MPRYTCLEHAFHASAASVCALLVRTRGEPKRVIQQSPSSTVWELTDRADNDDTYLASKAQRCFHLYSHTRRCIFLDVPVNRKHIWKWKITHMAHKQQLTQRRQQGSRSPPQTPDATQGRRGKKTAGADCNEGGICSWRPCPYAIVCTKEILRRRSLACFRSTSILLHCVSLFCSRQELPSVSRMTGW